MSPGSRSRSKGARGEREFVKFLERLGFKAKRYGHFQRADRGGTEFADVRCAELPNYHIEVKRREAINIWSCIAQAEKDVGESGKIPLVAFRRNGSPWMIALKAEDFLRTFIPEGGTDGGEEQK